MSNIYRTTTDTLPSYPSKLSRPDKHPPAPDPPHNSISFHTGLSPSPITVPTGVSPSPITVPTVVRKFTTDLPNMSPSPITVPYSSTDKTVKFQPNLFYNEVEDIHWYNNSPITESQYNWLVDRHNKGLEIPDKFTYPPKILYQEELDGTCWFKGYNISCETYYGLEEKQEQIAKGLAKHHKKPGLYPEPLEKITLLYLREIGNDENAKRKNFQIERDWKLVKKGPINVYRNYTITPGEQGDVLNDMKTIEALHQTNRNEEEKKDKLDLLQRYYNKDEYKTKNNVYKKITDAISKLKNPKTEYKEWIQANEYLNSMEDEMNEEPAGWVIGGKKGKKTKKRKINKKRKSLKKRKTNKKRKTLKK